MTDHDLFIASIVLLAVFLFGACFGYRLQRKRANMVEIVSGGEHKINTGYREPRRDSGYDLFKANGYTD